MKHAATHRSLVTFGLVLSVLLALLAGCRQEETRRMPQSQADSRIRAVQQAEMERAAQQRQAPQDQPPPSQATPSGGAQPATSPAQAPTPAQAAQPPAAPAPQPYMPPSEQGAYVEMTETPAGSPPPPASSPPRSAAPGAGAPGAPAGPRAGGGGNMPAGTPPPGAAPAPPVLAPPASPVGKMQPAGSPPPVGQTAVAPPAPGGDRLTTIKAELDRKLQEFDALMKRAQVEADKERAAGGAGAVSGRRDGRGGALESLPDDFGAGSAAERASGSGASPDLSGETSPSRVNRGPSAGRGPLEGEDDDIVARQLREAAEHESDPVLREKLWDEYRNYKAQ